MYPVCRTAIQIFSLPPNILKHTSTSSLPCQNVHALETKSNIDIQFQSHTEGSTGCVLTYVITDFMKLIVDKDLKITSVTIEVKPHHKINIGIKGNVSIATFDLCTKKELHAHTSFGLA